MNYACDPALLATLETMIAPGGRARVSLYVESAQFQMLFGERPRPDRRYESGMSLLRQHDARIKQLAEDWVQFSDRGKSFDADYYDSPGQLDAYLAYYCTVNVAKVQLCLLDLLRAGALPQSRLRIVDIGVGTGTSFLGVMDFLLTWATACALYDVDFPIEDVQFIGIDRNRKCLDYSGRVAQAYADVIQERLGAFRDANGLSAIRNVERWARAAQWIRHDLNAAPFDADEPNLLIASNSFNELDKAGQCHLGTMILRLPAQAVAIIIEPGDRKKSQALMDWRLRLVKRHPQVRIVGPCGHVRSSPLTDACSTCWNGRRESLHQPLLYKQFRQAAAALKRDDRPFHDFENELLSWTYTLFQKNEEEVHSASEPIRIQSGQSWPDNAPLVFIGAFSSEKQGRGRNGIGDALADQLVSVHQEDESNDTGNGARQYFKFCPGVVEQAQTLTLRRDVGIEIPPLTYGAEIIIRGAKVKKVSETRVEIEPSAKTRISLCSPATRATETFPDETTPRETPPEKIAKEPFLEKTFLKVYSERTRAAIDEIGYRLFGFPQMHAFQHRILAHVLKGRSILGIAATGGGKSECYILPSMLLPGITIVVSPLKSLMADQYEQRICQRYGLGNLSTFINGDVSFLERQRRLRHIELGHYKLVYVTPEQLERSYVLNSLQRAHRNVGIRYLALDEAHCISQWGHDFRPSYLNMLHRLRTRGLRPVRIALTATASPDVRQDLCEELDLNPASLDQGGDVYIESANRPELNLIVRVCRTTDEKVDAIISDLRRLQEANRRNSEPGAAIVFLPWTGGRMDDGALEQSAPQPAQNQTGEESDTDVSKPESQRGRRSAGVTRFASYLERTLGERVAIYHSKMDSDDPAEEEHQDAPDNHQTSNNRPLGDMSGRTRSEQQRAFITGECNIMVATKGFGMGIDKPNIRLVIHRTPPANLEAYAQEAGRAGRDRRLADVILYYSPDEAEDIEEFGKTTTVPSDRQIQERFLSEKYIRREDVIVMRAFLRSVTRRVAGRLYFTNDEAIAFFDQCVDEPRIAGLDHRYSWPTLPKRIPGGYESFEHKRILDRGHEYQHKTGYIRRILDVLYRVRPTTDAHVREALIEEMRQCGGVVINPRVYDVDAIFHSNAYFGELLRKSGIKSQEFKQLYESGDLIPLAERLAMPLSDLEQMIHDIRQSDGRRNRQTGDWRPTLLDGLVVAPWYGPAAGRMSLQQWRRYAGAWKRASKKVADRRAREAGRPKPDIDDWFGWREVCLRYGWEVRGGPALEREDDFADYLDRFMAVHDRRRANDWASYNRLLTDYVGVREDGSIDNARGKECLRAVMLGYLKTYEVIVGGNCYSCSRCVPDENFAQFDMEQRRRVVARMTEELERLFTQAEGLRDRLPDEHAIGRLFDAIRHAQASGSSLGAYLQGWTARLLQDAPNHQAALLIRATAMLEGVFELQPRDLLNMLQTLVDVAAVEESERIDRLMARAREHLSDSSEFHRLRATIARRLNNPQEEANSWTDVLRILEQSAHASGRMLYEPHYELMRLYAPESPLHDPVRYREHARHAARHAKLSDARAIYSDIMAHWEWRFIAEELDCLIQDGRNGARVQALLYAWLVAQPEQRAEVVAACFSANPSFWQTWSVDAIESIIRLFPEAILREHPRIALHVAHRSGDLDALVQWSQVIVERNEALADDVIERIALAATDGYEPARCLIDRLRSDPDRAESIYQVMKPVTIKKGWKHAAWFVDRFAERIVADEPAARLDILERCIDNIVNNEERSDALQRLERIARSLFDLPETVAQARSAWHRLYIEQPQAALSYLQECQSDPNTETYAIDCLRTLRAAHKPTVDAIYARLKPQCATYDVIVWCEWFEPEILADSPQDRLDVLKHALSMAHQTPDQTEFYKTLAPVAVSLWLDSNTQFRETFRFIQRCAIDHPETYDQIYNQLTSQLTKLPWRTVESWLAVFQPKIMQERPRDLMNLLRRLRTLLPQTTAERRAALRRLFPLVQKLLSDAAYGKEANELWGEICSSHPVYVAGDRIWHPSFGFGRVIKTSVLAGARTPTVVAAFDQAGVKELSLRYVGIGIVEFAQDHAPVTQGCQQASGKVRRLVAG